MAMFNSFLYVYPRVNPPFSNQSSPSLIPAQVNYEILVPLADAQALQGQDLRLGRMDEWV
jgi:hypothetical protein